MRRAGARLRPRSSMHARAARKATSSRSHRASRTAVPVGLSHRPGRLVSIVYERGIPMNRRRLVDATVARIVLPLLLLLPRVGSGQATERLPNLVPYPASELHVTVDTSTNLTLLRFSTVSYNNGIG